MLNTKPHTVAHEVDGEILTLVFYPDTGCLRFVGARGVCHELRPPHSWFAMSAAARGVRCGTQATRDGLSVLLNEFCARRPQRLCGPERLSADAAVVESVHAASREMLRNVALHVADGLADLGARVSA